MQVDSSLQPDTKQSKQSQICVNYRRKLIKENDNTLELIKQVVAGNSVILTLLHAKGLTLHLVYMLIPLLYGVGRVRHREILTQLAQLVDAGQVRPLLDTKVFNFSEVAEAHQRVESGQALGKVVLQQG